MWFQKISIPSPPKGSDFPGGGGVNLLNFPVGRGVHQREYFQRVLVLVLFKRMWYSFERLELSVPKKECLVNGLSYLFTKNVICLNVLCYPFEWFGLYYPFEKIARQCPDLFVYTSSSDAFFLMQ